MNFVTQELLRRTKDRRLLEFVLHWDQVESLVINTYRKNEVIPEDEEVYRHLRDWLTKSYPHWQNALRTHWQGTRVAGEIIGEDPFLEILAVQEASDFMGNWGAMQTLPAAREALNNLLFYMIEKYK